MRAHVVELLVRPSELEVVGEVDVPVAGEAGIEHLPHRGLDGLLGRYRYALGGHVRDELDDELRARLVALLAPGVGEARTVNAVEEVVEECEL